MRVCPCPVWIVQPAHQTDFQVVLAAIDPTGDDPKTVALNNKIIDLAVSLAQSESEELHVVHAWDATAALSKVRHITPDTLETIEGRAQ